LRKTCHPLLVANRAGPYTYLEPWSDTIKRALVDKNNLESIVFQK
jgi:hypothetical protein